MNNKSPIAIAAMIAINAGYKSLSECRKECLQIAGKENHEAIHAPTWGEASTCPVCGRKAEEKEDLSRESGCLPCISPELLSRPKKRGRPALRQKIPVIKPERKKEKIHPSEQGKLTEGIVKKRGNHTKRIPTSVAGADTAQVAEGGGDQTC